MTKSLAETVIELWKANKSVAEIHEITGARITDIEAILKKEFDGNRNTKSN